MRTLTPAAIAALTASLNAWAGPDARVGADRSVNLADLAAADVAMGSMLMSAVVGSQDAPTEPSADRTFGPGERFSSEVTRISRYGEEGTWQFNIFASGAWGESGLDENGDERDVNYFGGGIGVDYFIMDDFSAGAQLVGLGFTQDGPETAGGAFEVLLRWHFVSESTWSIYLDGGAGFLKTSDDVPPHGSNYNFTPQAGIGFTIEIGGQVRAMSGIRWHHISNADSADSNPGIDSLMIYGGITVPF